ncbi:FkbM family methyltransferase [Alteromonas antoniana]|uniref:FkbM family methyltransferase n=1 Tax=Alteromonas antoniana TaxID=2803813 RepID=UPI001C459BC9|nr:FkbM family methyltransferase [Alteromonas antoniana]
MGKAIATTADFVKRVLDRKRDGSLKDTQVLEFFHFAYPLAEKSYAQLYQDLWVLFMLKEKQVGFFVEFGACDGLSMSNTALLEREYGWKGILAEPNPRWHNALKQERNCSICFDCVTDGEYATTTFYDVESEPELSRLSNIVPTDHHEETGARADANVISVNCLSLNELLQRYNAPDTIDFLSIDTEGSEYEILKNFDIQKWHIKLIAVEHGGDQKKRERIKELLTGKGFSRWNTEVSRWDDWYVNQY